MSIQPDDRRDPADDPAAEPEPEPDPATASVAPVAPEPPPELPPELDGITGRSYRPPPSPAYAPQPTGVAGARPRGAPAADDGTSADDGDAGGPASLGPGTGTGTVVDTGTAASGAPADEAATSRLGWQLLIAGVVLVIVAGAVAVVALTSGGDSGPYAFGEVRAVRGEVVVRTRGDAAPRPLETGETVVAGWVIDTPDGGTATVDLAGGGVARADGGTRMRFVDLAVDEDTGERARDSEPAIDVSGGRLWLVPGDGSSSAGAVQARIADGTVASTGNPVAIDCTAECTVEAPAGGVTLTTDAGVDVEPAANEVVTVSGPTALELAIGDSVTEWARRNLDTDAEEGRAEPESDGEPGVVGSAILDGEYSVAVRVVGPPAGDPIPRALQYPEGETYAVDLTADGSACEPDSCNVPVTSDASAGGTARVGDGEVALTFSLPIDCYDQSHTRVVRPDIGSTAVEVAAMVEAVEFDGARWLVRRFSGTGTVAATLESACNPRDRLGTSTSPISVAAG